MQAREHVPADEHPRTRTWSGRRTAALAAAVVGVIFFGFFAPDVYSHYAGAHVDRYAVSIANNAAPSIEALADAWGDLRQIEREADHALALLASGQTPSAAALPRAAAQFGTDLARYLANPSYPDEQSLDVPLERDRAILDIHVSELSARLQARDLAGARSAMQLEVEPAIAQLDAALQGLIRFNALQESQMGMVIPALRAKVTRVSYGLEAVSAVIAVLLALLLIRGTRQYQRLLHAQRRSARDQAAVADAFSARLEALADASVRIGQAVARSGHDPQAVFQTIADEARRTVGADYASLGCGADPERPFAPWVYAGMSAEQAKAIGRAPRPVGVLAKVIRDQRVVRLGALGAQPEFLGLPAHHPEMGPFLGVPMARDGAAVGTLYLARKPGGAPFTAEDEYVVKLLSSRALVVLENARLYGLEKATTESREELLAVVSHDLKNPLTNLLLIARRLRDAPQASPQAVASSERIDRAVRRMLDIITSLLDASRLDDEPLDTRCAGRVEAGSLLSEAMEMFAEVAAEKQIRLVACPADGELAVHCDRAKIMRVLSNLIGNALKFTPEGGVVTLAAQPEGDEVRFSVADTGPGVPHGHLGHVFERYWQAKAGDHRGTGLGLYIAERIVRSHGGRIWAENGAERGATFYFALGAHPHQGGGGVAEA